VRRTKVSIDICHCSNLWINLPAHGLLLSPRPKTTCDKTLQNNTENLSDSLQRWDRNVHSRIPTFCTNSSSPTNAPSHNHHSTAAPQRTEKCSVALPRLLGLPLYEVSKATSIAAGLDSQHSHRKTTTYKSQQTVLLGNVRTSTLTITAARRPPTQNRATT
jgi:hypothetical protein